MPDNTNVSRRTAGPTEIDSTEARLIFNETDATATEQLWDIVATGDQLLMRTRTDADGAGATILTVDRSGTAVSSISLGGDLIFATDNVDDIGGQDVSRPRRIWVGTGISIGGSPPTTPAAAALRIDGSIEVSAGVGFVVNDRGADIDYRFETSGNTTALNMDGGSFGGTGTFSHGAAVLTTTYHAIQRPALTAGADLNYFDLNTAPSGAVTVPTGTAAIVATVNVEEPNITATGTVSDAYTMRIAAAPTEGTRNGALWVDAGVSRFDDSILIGGTAINSGNNQVNVYNGTAPTAAAADSVTLYSTDDTAGNTIPSFYCEGTGVLATAQADVASSVRVKMRINGTVVTLLAI